MLRHHKLRKGYHKAFVQASRRGVWLLYEKLGVRVVGDFKVMYPEADTADDFDESYRLAHYANYDHWKETRFVI